MNSDVKKRLRRLFSSANVDAIILQKSEPTGDFDFHAFTGIKNSSMCYSTAVLFPDKIHLICAKLEEEEAKYSEYDYTLTGKDALRSIIQQCKKIGVNGAKCSYQTALQLKDNGYKLKDVGELLNAKKRIKNPSEIIAMTKACAIASQVADKIPHWLTVGMTEQELAARIEYEMKMQGSQFPAFETIVAFGKNSAIPHYQPRNQKLKEDMIVLCDFGATVDYLRSDITRTYFFGIPSKKFKEMYSLVLDTQEKCIQELKSHRVNGLYKYAVKTINSHLKALKMNGTMNHGLGHGLGYDVHEDRIINLDTASLDVNSVTTVEPGAYVPGYGGVRIEDDILITKSGINSLTFAKKKWNDIVIPLR